MSPNSIYLDRLAHEWQQAANRPNPEPADPYGDTRDDEELVRPRLVFRRDIKLYHCASPKANDATIRQALVDRFAYGQANHGKGTKTAPGFFYRFKADVWQAYALAVYVADREATS